MEAAASPSFLLCLAIRTEGGDVLGRVRNNHLYVLVLVLLFSATLAVPLAARKLERASIIHRGGVTCMMSGAGAGAGAGAGRERERICCSLLPDGVVGPLDSAGGGSC
jgi:hypothetical protein